MRNDEDVRAAIADEMTHRGWDTKRLAQEAGVPAAVSTGFGDYQTEYKQLWGLQ